MTGNDHAASGGWFKRVPSSSGAAVKVRVPPQASSFSSSSSFSERHSWVPTTILLTSSLPRHGIGGGDGNDGNGLAAGGGGWADRDATVAVDSAAVGAALPHRYVAEGGPFGAGAGHGHVDADNASGTQYRAWPPDPSSSFRSLGTEPRLRLSRASTVSASITFLKAMLGVSLMSHPRILGETGLILGTVCHLVIIVACAFACYLLLKARDMAAEAMEMRDGERRRFSGPIGLGGDVVAARTRTMPRRAVGLSGGRGIDDDGLSYHHDDGVAPTPVLPPPMTITTKEPRPFEVVCGEKGRLMTYGDVARQLMGRRAAAVITWTVVLLHVLFASAMASGVITGTSLALSIQTDDGRGGDGSGGGHGRYVMEDDSADGRYGERGYWREVEEGGEERDDMYWATRWGLALMLFPVVAVLLQIPTLRELFVISAAGLVIYLVGCVGCMIYTALETARRENGRWMDAPDDLWEWKMGGIPVFVASTLYTIEGINLALPTANNMDNPALSVPVVCFAVVLYGLLTLSIAWVGYLGGFGGGEGTEHGPGACRQVFLCIETPLVRAIYEVCMSTALLLTLPVILYPSTEILEIWATEQDEDRRKKKEAAEAIKKDEEEREEAYRQATCHRSSPSSREVLGSDNHSFPGDASAGVGPLDFARFISENIRMSLVGPAATTFDEDDSRVLHTTASDLDAEPTTATLRLSPVACLGDVRSRLGGGDSLVDWRAGRRFKVHRRMRFLLAVTVCSLGLAERSVSTAFGFVRGIGLSFVGFILPPVLYIIAREETERHVVKVKGKMMFSLACLIGFGFFNIALVCVSSFTNHSYASRTR